MQTRVQAPAEVTKQQNHGAQQPAQLLVERQSSFEDHSPQTAQLTSLRAMMSNSPLKQRTQAIQAKTNGSARTQHMRTLQARLTGGGVAQREEAASALEAPKPNNTGLPDNLKSGIESLSGMSMDHVKVNYNSSQPAQLNAHAYAQGSEIHVAPGQEQHLPHEAWHVVQQAQGRVKQTMQMHVDDKKNKIDDAESNTAQLKGPRNYSKTFKGEKDEMMDWLKDSEMIGIDLTADEETTEEENQKIGWHHQYPYSHLWENHNHHALSDHGANLKLGPMKNRLGDPGHEIDISYGKAKAKEEAESNSDIEPTYSPLSAKLLEELTTRPKVGTKPNGPTKDIDIRNVDHSGMKNEVYPKSSDKEEYWSEWYLSLNIRNKLLSEAKVGEAIDGLKNQKIINAKASIFSKLNQKLDSLCYTYATHTPALEDGTLGTFQQVAIIETGIPSSKLNKKGVLAEKMVVDVPVSYADLVHGILVSEKWITRGAQGAAHSLTEQFKEKMKIGNLELIHTLLKADNLMHLKSAVEEEYKLSVFESLPSLDNIEDTKNEFFVAIERMQKEKGAVILDKTTIENIVDDTLGTLDQTRTVVNKVAPEQIAESFIPHYPTKGEDAKLLRETFENYLSNDDYEESLGQIARNIIALNALDNESYEEDKHVLFDWEGNAVLTVGDLCTGIFGVIEKLIPKTVPKKGSKATPASDMAKANDFCKLVIDWLNANNDTYDSYWQEPDEEEEEIVKTHTKTEVYMQFSNRHKSKGKNYVQHLLAIADGAAHVKYGVGIERALHAPGKGYNDPSLKYPTPEVVSGAEAGAVWDYTSEQELQFRLDWYEAEFREFLTSFIAANGTQKSLLNIVP